MWYIQLSSLVQVRGIFDNYTCALFSQKHTFQGSEPVIQRILFSIRYVLMYTHKIPIKYRVRGYLFVQEGYSLLEKGRLVSSRSPFELRWNLCGLRS